MYFDKNRKVNIEYFDSYDLHPGVNSFTAFMERKSKDCVYNSKTVCFLKHVVITVCILFFIVVMVLACMMLFLVSHRTLLKIIATLTCLFVLSRCSKSKTQMFYHIYFIQYTHKENRTSDIYSMYKYNSIYNSMYNSMYRFKTNFN